MKLRVNGEEKKIELDQENASNADGIHLGQDDLDLKTARKLL